MSGRRRASVRKIKPARGGTANRTEQNGSFIRRRKRVKSRTLPADPAGETSGFWFCGPAEPWIRKRFFAGQGGILPAKFLRRFRKAFRSCVLPLSPAVPEHTVLCVFSFQAGRLPGPPPVPRPCPTPAAKVPGPFSGLAGGFYPAHSKHPRPARHCPDRLGVFCFHPAGSGKPR